MNTIRSRAALALLLFLAAACGRGGEAQDLHIALAGPVNQPNGESMLNAARMAVEEINEAGVIPGYRLVLEVHDDRGDAQNAQAIAGHLARDPRILAVVGHLNSAASRAAADAYNGRMEDTPPLLQISPASSSPDLTHAGEWTFRVTPTDLEFSPVLAQAVADLGLRRAAVLYDNDDYGRGVQRTFDIAFRERGGVVVTADPYRPAVLSQGDELDPFLRRAQRQGMEALVIGGQAESGVRIVAAARRLGFTGPILGADGMTSAKDMGPVAEGIFISSAFLPDRDTDAARTFVERYRAAYEALPDHRGAMAYDVVQLLALAIRDAGTDRLALRDHVARIGNDLPAYQGVSGNIAFDENGDVRGKVPTLGVIRNGELVTYRP